MHKICISGNQYVNSCNQSWTPAEYFSLYHFIHSFHFSIYIFSLIFFHCKPKSITTTESAATSLKCCFFTHKVLHALTFAPNVWRKCGAKVIFICDFYLFRDRRTPLDNQRTQTGQSQRSICQLWPGVQQLYGCAPEKLMQSFQICFIFRLVLWIWSWSLLNVDSGAH